MRHSYWKAGLALAGAVGLCVSVSAQQPQTQKPTVKRTTAQPIASVEGRDNFIGTAPCATAISPRGTGRPPQP